MPVFTDFEGQEIIDAKIAEHENRVELCDLRRRRNTLTAIYNLPNEILSIIFVFCKSGSEMMEIPMVWRTILSVCSQWRDLALATPRFSNDIVLSEPHNAVTMLNHSGRAPIRLTYPFHSLFKGAEATQTLALVAFMHVLENCGGRLRSLTILFGNSNIAALAQAFETAFKSSCRSLRILALVYTDIAPNTIYTLPHPLPWAFMPFLRTMELYDVLVQLPTWLRLPSLTNLKLSGELQRGMGIPTLYAIRILQKTPNVKFVAIKDLSWHPCCPLSVLGTQGLPVSMPKLQSLMVKSDLFHGCEFLVHLVIPRSASLYLYFANAMDARSISMPASSPKCLALLLSLSRNYISQCLIPPHNMLYIATFTNASRSSIQVGTAGPVHNLFRKSHVYFSAQQSIFGLPHFLAILTSSQIISRISLLSIFYGHQMAWWNKHDVDRSHGGQGHLDPGCWWSKILPAFHALRGLLVTQVPLSFLLTLLQQTPGNRLLQIIHLYFVQCGTPSGVSIGDGSSSSSFTASVTPDVCVEESGAENPERNDVILHEEVGGDVERQGRVAECEDVGADIMCLAKILKSRQDAGLPRISFVFGKCNITERQVQFLREHAEVERR